ncbi:MAG: hypothetical protein LQ344_007844 [Seirophora lacunosa]|nr:MAG: hypothetical protein LQ344_007844 [Seirophora lacunosa]
MELRIGHALLTWVGHAEWTPRMRSGDFAWRLQARKYRYQNSYMVWSSLLFPLSSQPPQVKLTIIIIVHSTSRGYEYCSTALSIVTPQNTYTYIACGAQATTDRLLPSTTPASDTQSFSQAAPSTRTGSFLFSPASTLSTDVSSSTISGSDSAIITSAGALAAATSMPASQASSSNNTGPIVGGVIGGLAFLALLVFGILVLRRLKSRHPTAPHSSTSFWPMKKKNNNIFGTAKNDQDRWVDQHNQWLSPMELEAEEKRGPSELPSGKHGMSHELDSQRP